MKQEIRALCRQKFEVFARRILPSLGDFYNDSPYTRAVLFHLENFLGSLATRKSFRKSNYRHLQ